MKKIALLILSVLVLTVFSCKKPVPRSEDSQESSGNQTSGSTEEKVKPIPSIVKFERGAGLYNKTGPKDLEYADARLEQFDSVQYLGQEKEMNYLDGGKKASDPFSLCLVQVGDEQLEYWIYSANLAYNTKVGVVLNDCLLYKKDKLDKISDKELKQTALVITDNDFFHKDFFKIFVPSISTKTPYYIRKSDLSLTPADIAVARLYKTAMGLGEGKEKAKAQILQSALSEYSQSSLISLIETELVVMGVLGPGDVDAGGMGGEYDEGMEGDGYYDEDPGMGDDGEYYEGESEVDGL